MAVPDSYKKQNGCWNCEYETNEYRALLECGLAHGTRVHPAGKCGSWKKTKHRKRSDRHML